MRVRAIVIGQLVAALAAVPATAQRGAPSEDAPRTDVTASAGATSGDTLGVRRSILPAAHDRDAAILTAARGLDLDLDLDPFDLRVAASIRESRFQESGPVRAAAGVFRLAGIPGTILLAGGLFGVGEVTDRDDLRDMGLHTGQAIVLAGGATAVGKVAFGRARPHTSPEDPYDVRFGRGLEGDRFQSFPSAHTAAAFATAAAMASELSDRHPGSGIWIYPSAFTAASLAGLSRLFHDEHWATDVVAGALIGSLSGWLVSDHHAGGAE